MSSADNSIPLAASRVPPTYAYNLLYIPQTLFVALVPIVAHLMTTELAKTIYSLFSLPDVVLKVCFEEKSGKFEIINPRDFYW